MRTIVPHGARLVSPQATRVFKGIIFDVYHWQQPRFDGTTATFEMLKRPDTIKIIAVKDGKLVAITDEQPGREPKLTLPGGRHDVETETELDCAKRELLEETGMVFGTWKLISARQPQDKIEQMVYIYIATDFMSQQPATPDVGGEKITVQLMGFDTARRWAIEKDDPYWPVDILRRVTSLDGLLALPEYTGQPPKDLLYTENSK